MDRLNKKWFDYSIGITVLILVNSIAFWIVAKGIQTFH